METIRELLSVLPTSKLQPIHNLYEMSLLIPENQLTFHTMDPI